MYLISEVRIIKKYLLLIVLFTFIGCASTSLEPVTQPDKRIQLGGFSFLPPKGENWGIITNPNELNLNWETSGSEYRKWLKLTNELKLTWETWGRGTVKWKAFKKSLMGPTQKPGEAEVWKAQIIKYEFAIMKFDQNDNLMELAQEGYISLDQKGIGLLESNFSIETIKEMNCVRSKGKAEGGREISNSKALATTIYMQGFICVDPRNPNHLIELRANQSVVKGQTPTDIQNELELFFNSLKAH